MVLIPLFVMASLFQLLLLPSAWCAQSLTYHGRITKVDGSALEAAIVNTKIQIRSPGTENCLLYEETRNLDMTNSNGVYSLVIGDGSGTRTDSTGYSLSALLSNRTGFTFSNGECTSVTSYTPAATDRRIFVFEFKESSASTWEVAASDFISAAPVAIEATQIGGYGASALCRVENAGVPVAVSALTSAQFTEFLALVNGTSTLYQPAGVIANGSITAAKLESATNGQMMIGNGTGFTKASLTAGSGITITPGAGSITIAATGSGSGTVTSVSSANSDIAVSMASPTPVLTLNSATSGGASDAGKVAKLDGSGLLTLGMLPTVSIAKGGTNSTTALTNDKVMISSAGSIIEGVASNTAKSNNTFVIRDGSGNLAGALGSFDQLALNGSVSGTLSIYPPSTFTSWDMTLPISAGTNGQVLSTNGSGVTSWISALTATTGFSNGGNSFGSDAILGTNDAYALNFETGGTTKMTILNNGNVGIGTTNPGAKLEVNGVIRVPQGTGGYSFPALSAASQGIYSSDGTNDIWLSPFYDILFAPANSSGRFRPSNDNTSGLGTPTQRWLSLSVGTGSSTFAGNVGIGTTNPTQKLTVAGGGIGLDNGQSIMGKDTTGTYRSLVYIDAADNVGFRNMATAGNAYYGIADYGINTAGKTIFTTASGSAMAILPNGDIGIGAFEPTSKLQVAGNITPDATASRNLGSSSLRWNNIYLSNAPDVSSDLRLKKEVKTSDLGLDFINTLRPVSWTWKDPSQGTGEHYGVIAQEAAAAIAEVKGQNSQDVIVSHNEESDSYSVRYTELISPLIKAIQELYQDLLKAQAIIDSQDRQMASLKAEKVDQEALIHANERIEKLEAENRALKIRFDRLEKALQVK